MVQGDKHSKTVNEEIVKYYAPQADAIYESALFFVKWFNSRKALRKLPECYGRLRNEYDKLWDACVNIEKSQKALESDKAVLQQQNSQLESEKADLQRQKSQLESEKANLQKQYDAMLAKMRALTANNPSSVSGNSATTYLQWIERYIKLLEDFSLDVLDLVADTPENIDDFRNFVTSILEAGFVAPLGPSEKAEFKKQIDRFLRPEYRAGEFQDEETQKKYKQYGHFFDDLFELVNKAEKYKEDFCILVPQGVQFNSKCARIPGYERKKQDDKNKGKKSNVAICRRCSFSSRPATAPPARPRW